MYEVRQHYVDMYSKVKVVKLEHHIRTESDGKAYDYAMKDVFTMNDESDFGESFELIRVMKLIAQEWALNYSHKLIS